MKHMDQSGGNTSVQATSPSGGRYRGRYQLNGTAQADSNAGDTTRPGWPAALRAARPATSSALGGTANRGPLPT
jgi:hypothetical protein